MRPTQSFSGPLWPLIFIFITSTISSFSTHDGSFQPDYILRATAQNISIDCESRYSVVLNGTSPGPPLYLREGWTTWIRVYNDIKDQNLTIHWHGLAQRSAPFADGTPQVSQWPIGPGSFFDYEVHPDVGDAGTYFYHSHVGFQAISATGPLIVEECGPPPYHYDENIVLQIGDHYNKTDDQIEEGLLANPFKWSGETKALLINGHSGKASLSNASDVSCAPHVIKVKPDTTYRMRVVGGTAISLVTLGIEGHTNFTVIEADGAYSKPVTTDHIQIASGQRFSVLFKTKSAKEITNLNKTFFFVRYENRERPSNVSGYAILAYSIPEAILPRDLPSESPIKLPEKIFNWLEYTLQPYNASFRPFPSKPTRTVIIQVNQVGNFVNSTWKSTLEWAQNGLPWQETLPSSPYLVNIYKQGQAAIPNYEAAIANNGWDPATSVFPAKLGEILDIVWQNGNGPSGGFDIHPMHAHGAHIWDLGSGNGTYNAEENDKKFKDFTPIKRDTTMLYRYSDKGVANTTAGWRAWRVQVDHVGLWMMHCHILQHMIMGMMTSKRPSEKW